MLANRFIYRPEMGCQNVDPYHDTVPVIRWSTYTNATDSMPEMILSVTRSGWLDECLCETSIRETSIGSPESASSILVVAVVEMHRQCEFRVHVKVRLDPPDEHPERRWIGVAEVEVVARFGTFAPVEDHSGDEVSIVKM
jgi:hypothetical protein